ncbi:uncharacterized protein PAC_19913 [Phialocephala subalpina]|uniref:Uncharacterized protein n=1 Tax=Phialocephala subalpina TaxID=576137 RepID=A0A1L7XY60_9HELO|nr:uncharacterized protein PAC_19913 [Phialocephala subalpina]
MSATVRGFKLGEINAAGAATAEFSLVGHPPLQQIANMQDMERRIMDARPGMYIKYFPCRYDAVTGDLKVGGGYLFDSRQNAEGYNHWATNEFEVDGPGEPPKKEKFWSRSIFKDVQRRTWDVIGACNFTFPDQHAVVRFQRWSYTDTAGDDNAIALLKQTYEIIRETARKRRGAGAVWVLIRPEDRLIGMVTTVSKVADGNDSTEAGNMSIAELERQPSLGAHLPPQLGAVEVYNRTSLMLTIWMPTSRLAGGVHQTTPNFPLLPAVTNLS